MKTALTALAMIATATVAWADDDFSVIDNDSIGNGQYEIVTRDNGIYTLTRVNCLPMKSAIVDQDDDFDDLSANSNVALDDVLRGTTEHAIALAACGNA